MTNEHNPIAVLVSKIQQKWNNEISPLPDLKWIRWLINDDEPKLFEGFLKLESSPHGKVAGMLFTLLTPFKGIKTFSNDLIKSFFECYEKEQNIFDQLKASGKEFNWDYEYYKKQLSLNSINPQKLLIEILYSFHAALKIENTKFCLALFPYSISNNSEFQDWFFEVDKMDIPDDMQFCVFDFIDDRLYEQFFSSKNGHKKKTVTSDADVKGAIKKTIQSRNPTDPGAKLQQYILAMSEAVAQKNLSVLNETGNNCINDIIIVKNKSLLATAYLAYSAMLFQFKKYEEIEKLLNSGVKYAEAGKKTDETTCSLLLIQYYNMKASCYQLSKRYKEAIHWFVYSAEKSLELKQSLQSLIAYRQASHIAKAHDREKYPVTLEKGFEIGKTIPKEQLTITDFNHLALDYYNLLVQNGDSNKSISVDEFMKSNCGIEWKDETEHKLKNQLV